MEVTEEQLAAAAVAPRVTKEDVERAIREGKVTYTVLPNGRTTVCCIEIFGGRFSVTGESSCVSKANFNPVFGENIAFKEAEQKLWPVLGAVLAQKLSLIDAAGPATGHLLSLGSPLTYVGTKVVRALPMNRIAYTNLRGWTLPSDENGEDAGYLVEYVDGGSPNVEGFTGYISWSPADVFERAYTVGTQPRQTTWLERLQQEVRDRSGELERLMAFIGTPAYEKLADIERRYLAKQRDCMEELVWILTKRIEKATGIVG